MIEKLYESYDDNNYYISTNKKKLAHDNADVIGGVLTFFAFVSFIFVAVGLAFGEDFKIIVYFLPAVAVILMLFLLHGPLTRKLDYDFRKIRIYAFVIYAIVILSFSLSDASFYRESRAVFFPAAMILLSALYMDYVWIMLGYKTVLAILFLVFDYTVKSRTVFVQDVLVAIFAIIGSMFCYSTIIGTALSRHQDSEQLVKKSQTDLLTGLLNKVSFEEKCRSYLESRVIGAKCTLFIFDLDDFKEVNDNYGHQTGDKVLKLFSEILKGYFHPDDIIGRVGGDEFMVLVLGDMPDGFAERRCRSVIHELKTTDVDGDKGITCSIGIAEDTQGHNFDDLYAKADSALYRSKEDGKARFTMDKFV